MTEQHIPKIRAWLMAARPKTLPAAVGGMAVGTALAIRDSTFAPLPALAALAGALLFQIAVNFANDYFDYMRGIDTEERLGPTRVTQSGLIAPAELRLGLGVVIVLLLLDGLYLVSVGGWFILFIGLAAIASTLAYSGGPFPLASHGLGDLFVFLFFGLASVCGTYYVQAQTITPPVVIAALPVGALITAILVVNNIRDIPSDAKTGKRTLAVIFGARFARIEYAVLVWGAYAVPAVMMLSGDFEVWILLPWGTMLLAWRVVEKVQRKLDGPGYNRLLADTAQLSMIYSLLFAMGIVI